MDKEEALITAVRLAKELELKEGEIETLEQGEAITSLVIPEIMDLIPDQGARDAVRWLQEAHVRQNRHRWENVAKLTLDLFNRAGGSTKVKSYHEIEAYVAELDVAQIKSVEDEQARRALMAIKFIHTKTQERMTRLVAQCYDR